MPLVSALGEQSLNASIGIDQAGFGVWLTRDSDYNLLGFVSEFVAGDPRTAIFFVENPFGAVSERYELAPDASYYVAAYDQDAFLFYPVDGDSATFPPFVFRAGSEPFPFEGDVGEYPSTTVVTGMGLFRQVGEDLVPAGRATQTDFANGTARVYLAPDGDGTGVFLEVTDGDGNRLGGVVRVNDDVAGDQSAAQVGTLDEAFTVAWTQESYDGANTELYLAKSYRVDSNVDLAVGRTGGVFAGDAGDYVTDIFLLDAENGDLQARERITDFGANDIFVTTTKLVDNNNDGIIGFGDNRRVELNDSGGDQASSVAIAGVTALEFDGTRQSFEGGPVYYVYSLVGSSADEYYLLPGF